MTARASADGAGLSFIALGGYPSRCDSVNKRFVVAFVLAGVGSGELGDSQLGRLRLDPARSALMQVIAPALV